MDQRSQIYIRIWDKDNDNPKLYTKYYGWNFGERMISRARHGIEYIKSYIEYISLKDTQEKLCKNDINKQKKEQSKEENNISEVEIL